jgi:peroxiredoxin
VDKLEASLDKNELGYTLLSDSKMEAARAFGIAFQVDDAMFETLKGYGIDIEADSGEKHRQLPVPAVFLIGDKGIEFQYVNPNYRVRLAPEVLLAAAEAAVE